MTRLASFLRCAVAAFVALPAFAQEPASLQQDRGLQAAAFLRVPLGPPSGQDNQASFGLGVYGTSRCTLLTDLASSSCRSSRPAAGLELRATGDDRLGLWMTGSRQKELLAFARPAPISGDRKGVPPSDVLSLTGNDWVTIGWVTAAVIVVGILTIQVECDDFKIDPNTGQQTNPC